MKIGVPGVGEFVLFDAVNVGDKSHSPRHRKPYLDRFHRPSMFAGPLPS